MFRKIFPKWFDTWSAANPTNVYGPGILVGVAGGAVVVAILLVVVGQPYATDSLQTGPRGTGMSVPEFEADLAEPDPAIAGFVASTSEPLAPEGGAQMATAARENVPPALEGLTVENYDRLLAAMREWTGIPDLFEDPDSYQTSVGHRMIEMTQNINENWDIHVNANAQVGVTCYTCHRGQAVPGQIWFRDAPVVEAMAGWGAVQNRVTASSQFTSLPSDALESYLLNYEIIGVHDLASRVAGSPSDPAVPAIQNAERTYSLMNYFANSLGANCLTCHNSRAFYDAAQVTPQWNTANLGITMVQELNNDYLLDIADLLPDKRLGPVHQDAPKLGCATCHNGYLQPLQGTNVIGDWPELATTSGEPTYAAAE